MTSHAWGSYAGCRETSMQFGSQAFIHKPSTLLACRWRYLGTTSCLDKPLVQLPTPRACPSGAPLGHCGDRQDVLLSQDAGLLRGPEQGAHRGTAPCTRTVPSSRGPGTNTARAGAAPSALAARRHGRVCAELDAQEAHQAHTGRVQALPSTRMGCCRVAVLLRGVAQGQDCEEGALVGLGQGCRPAKQTQVGVGVAGGRCTGERVA